MINNVFNTLIFQKADMKEGFIIYAAQISSMYGDNKKQYILAFVPEHLAIKNRAYLSELPWINLQTRLISKSYPKIIPQKWNFQNSKDFFFRADQRLSEYTKYMSEDGYLLELLLINNPKKKTIYQYHERMTLIEALNTFQCVINYIGSQSPMLFSTNQDSSYGTRQGQLDPSSLMDEVDESFELI